MNNKIFKTILAAAIFFSSQVLIINTLRAQTDVDLGTELGGRLSFSLDKKVARGLHLSLEEELRMANNFGSFERSHTTLGISYKANDYLRFGVGYALINRWDSDNNTFKSPRHRLMVDATGSVHFGLWRLSLKERFQATYQSGDMNEYQNPRTALSLKSRLKLQYKGFRRIEPYTYIELRNTLNAPTISATYNEASDVWGYLNEDGDFFKKGDAGWFLNGFNKSYVNRIRFALGAEYRIDRRNYIEVCLMADRVMEDVIDANAEGTKLKSYTHETGLAAWVTAAYRYKF